MTWEEFSIEFRRVRPDVTAANLAHTSCSTREAIQTVYRSRKGDALFFGPDRKLRCAQWVNENQDTVQRMARMIARREQRERWFRYRAYAEQICSEVIAGTRSEYSAAQALKTAMNLEVAV